MWSSRWWLQVNWQQILLISLIFIPAHILLAIIGRNIPYTAFYRYDSSRAKELENMRQSSSLNALKDLREFIKTNHIQGPIFNRESAEKVCVEVISVSRPDNNYLTQTIAALLTRIPLRLQNQIRITIHNVNSPADENLEAQSLADLVKVVKAEYRLDRHPDNYSQHDGFVKEVIDYISVLDHVENLNCQYILLLEDDTIATNNWGEKLLNIISQLELYKVYQPFLVLKLYSTFTWVGFQIGNFKDITLILLCTFVLIIISLPILWLYQFFAKVILNRNAYNGIQKKESFKAAAHHQVNAISLVLLVVFASTFVVALGKYNIIRYGEGLHEVSIGCSCVANLYPQSGVQLLRNYMDSIFEKFDALNSLKDLPKKDLFFTGLLKQEELKNGWRYKELIHLPNLFQHVGLKTSLPKESDQIGKSISPHYPDDNLPITFDKRLFLS